VTTLERDLATFFAPDAELAWPEALPDHLSATQMGMAQKCWEQYRRRYVLGQKVPPGGALVWGIADHYAHEVNFTQKIESGVDIGEEDVKLAFAEGFDRAVDRNGGTSEIKWEDDKPGELKDAGVRLAATYHRQVSPRIQPTSVERKFSIEIPNVPVPVIGYIDLEAERYDETSEPFAVDPTERVAIERKTAKRKESQPKPDWRVQGRLYQYVADLPVEWHISAKTKTPAVYTPREEPGLVLPREAPEAAATAALVATTARSIVAMYETFGPDEPWPGALTHPWACSWCGYRSSCRWWGNS
jgi:hypothetical protein